MVKNVYFFVIWPENAIKMYIALSIHKNVNLTYFYIFYIPRDIVS